MEFADRVAATGLVGVGEALAQPVERDRRQAAARDRLAERAEGGLDLVDEDLDARAIVERVQTGKVLGVGLLDAQPALRAIELRHLPAEREGRGALRVNGPARDGRLDQRLSERCQRVGRDARRVGVGRRGGRAWGVRGRRHLGLAGRVPLGLELLCRSEDARLKVGHRVRLGGSEHPLGILEQPPRAGVVASAQPLDEGGAVGRRARLVGVSSASRSAAAATRLPM